MDPRRDAFKLLYGFAGFQSLHACVELDIFERLEASAGATLADLLEATGARPYHLRSLLGVACSYGLLEKEGGRYRCSELAARYFECWQGLARNFDPARP